MRLGLKGPGGFGGLRIEGQIDTDDLSPELAKRASDILKPELLLRAERTGAGMMTDPEHYDLTVIKDGVAHEYHLQAPGAPDELMSLLGDLMHEVIVRKAKSKGK